MTAVCLFCFIFQPAAVFPGGNAVKLAESPVEGGVVLVTDHLSHLLQRNTFADQSVSHDHPPLCHKIVEGAVCLLLKQLGYRGNTDTAVGGNDLQRDPLLQMGIHIGGDPGHHGIFSLCGTGAFLTHYLFHLFRKVLLIYDCKPMAVLGQF